jgi:3-dehydroquinate synthase class II
MADEASISVNPGGYEPRCKACNHPGHEEHDKTLLSGKLSDSDYAKIVGCSSKSIARHRIHIAKEIAQSAKAQAIITADELFQSVQDEAVVVRELRDAARNEGDIELALKTIDRALKCIELYAKIQGIIKDQPTINITLNAEWVELRTLIVTALDPYPQAKEAVVDAIHGR